MRNRGGGRLWNCLNALRRQKVSPQEVLVCDLGSEPKQKENIKRLTLEAGFSFLGIQWTDPLFSRAVAINCGIRAARTKYVLVLDADAIVSPRCIEVFERRVRPRTMVLAEHLRGRGPKGMEDISTTWGKLRAESTPPQWSHWASGIFMGAERTFWAEIGAFDERFIGWGGEDDYVVHKARQAGTVQWIKEPLLIHQRHANVPGKVQQQEKNWALLRTLMRRPMSVATNPWGRRRLTDVVRSEAPPPAQPTHGRCLVFGLGTGRCGTQSLSHLLSNQDGGRVTHEGDEDAYGGHLSWGSDWPKLKRQIGVWRRDLRAGKVNVVGDVALYYLPYVDRILGEAPEAKFICLERPKAEVVASYLKKTPRTNPWMVHDGAEWFIDEPWDRCYPKHPGPSKEEAIGQYWDDYHDAAKHLEGKYPDNFRVFPISSLNTPAGRRRILDFVGVPSRLQEAETTFHTNVLLGGSKARRSAEECLADTTLIVKAFERPEVVDRLLLSIDKYYGVLGESLRIVIADDSKEPVPPSVRTRNRVDYLTLPYDVGLSAGRNFLVDQVETDFFILLDDDMVFTDKTKIEGMVYALDNNDNFDIVGGNLLDGRGNEQKYVGQLQLRNGVLTVRNDPKDIYGRFHVYDFVINFFAARTKTVRKVKWPAELKLGEHVFFFLDAQKAGLTVVQHPLVTASHLPVTNEHYASLRSRAMQFLEKGRGMYGIRKIRNLTDRVVMMEPPCT